MLDRVMYAIMGQNKSFKNTNLSRPILDYGMQNKRYSDLV